MTRWEKLSTVLLRLVDSARQQSGAIAHMTSKFGRSLDTLERIEARQEEIHASHQKSNREYSGLEARVTKLERGGNAAE
jgi:hypothetical protein